MIVSFIFSGYQPFCLHKTILNWSDQQSLAENKAGLDLRLMFLLKRE